MAKSKLVGVIMLVSAASALAGPVQNTVVTFDRTTNGANPLSTLIADTAGNLYGTTNTGGTNGDGTVFEIAAGTHILSTLITFNGTNGARIPLRGWYLTRRVICMGRRAAAARAGRGQSLRSRPARIPSAPWQCSTTQTGRRRKRG